MLSPSFARRARAALLAATVLGGAALGIALPRHAEAYELGRGLSLFGGRLVLGGYASLDAEFLDEETDQLVLDDLSTFWTLNLADHWLVFAEAELEESVHVDGDGVGLGDDVFSLERLYGQWQGSDRLRVRAGQMLTPFGIWNLIHAEPLVWTSSRPIATEAFFDTGTTGLEVTLSGTFRSTDLALTTFGQATPNIDDTGDPQEARRGFGARLTATPDGGPTFGASFLRFRDGEDHRHENAVGADAIWSTRRAELSSEFAVNVADSGDTTWGAYAQLVLHAPWRLHPILRVEYADIDERRVPVVLGVAWKPHDAAIVKVEGIVGGHDTSLGGDGARLSFAVLF